MHNMVRTLALDLGSKTGWATRNDDGIVVSGTLDTAKTAKAEGTTRYGALWLFLNEHVKQGDLVAFEDVAFTVSVRQAHVYGGLRAIVETACCEIGAECRPVPVSVIKKHATGAGNADKRAMLAAARARGFSPKDDNEADALALLAFVTGEAPKVAPRRPRAFRERTGPGV